MNIQYIDIQPRQPENIALSFSGGGFRAAAYSLGCLSYMNKIEFGSRKLTELINFISSASGGTITNLVYTSKQRIGQSFEQFYKEMNEQILFGTNLVNRVFEIMKEDKCWKERPLKSRNFINAFSIAYDEILFRQQTFEIYWKPAPMAVPEVCVNTTEFDNGMLFRFQNAGVIGNKFLYFKNDIDSQETLKQIKLGDILACSSCFPVGFEPFMFPMDFTHKMATAKKLEDSLKEDTRFSQAKKDEFDEIKKPSSFGLMDGGIDDNQGIGSFMLAEERLQNKNKFGYDLYISCDVSSNYTTGYDFPKENKKSFLQRFSMLQYIILIFIIFGLSIVGAYKNILTIWSYVFIGVTGVLIAIILVIFIKSFFTYKKSIRIKNTFAIIIFNNLKVFLKLRLSILLQMLFSRGSSAAYLASVVFLKKIRRISYDRIFEKVSEREKKENGQLLQPEEDESLISSIELKHWKKFTIQNAIYLLSQKNNHQRIADIKKEIWFKKNISVIIERQPLELNKLIETSIVLQQVADTATDMDTTLWFDDNHRSNNKPAALVATGQFTTCYNLLRYAFRFDNKDPYWEKVQFQLVKDWSKFNQYPYWMYDEYKGIIS